MKIGAVILAAGLSRRMGKPKQFLHLQGKPLFMYSVALAIDCGLEPIVLVVGKEEEKYKEFLHHYPEVLLIKNEHYEQGMGTSLKLGVQMLKEKVNAALIFLADQPFLTKAVVKKMISEYEHSASNGYSIIRPQYGAVKGHPILFDCTLFDEFDELSGDFGGKLIVEKYRKSIKTVQFEQEILGFDVDTHEDYIVASQELEGKKDHSGEM